MNKKQNGSALVIMLIIVIILSYISFYAIKLTKDIVYMEKSIFDKIEAKLNTKSSLEIVKYTLSISSFNTNFVENYSQTNFLPKNIYLTGKIIKTPISDIQLLDTSSKINALYLEKIYIRRLFENLKLKNQIADIASDSYEDWIDKDNLKHINGAEKYYYMFEKGFKYPPRNNQAIQDKDELKNIRGFTQVYDKIKDYLIFSYKGNLLNINTADAITLSVILDIPIHQAKSIEKLRAQQGNIEFPDIERITGKNISSLIDLCSIYPSKVVVIKIKSKKNEAIEKLKAVVDFNGTENYPYIVIKYVE